MCDGSYGSPAYISDDPEDVALASSYQEPIYVLASDYDAALRRAEAGEKRAVELAKDCDNYAEHACCMMDERDAALLWAEEAEAEVEQEGDGAEVNAAEYQLQLDAGGDVPQLQVDAVPEAGEEAEAAAAAGAQEEQLGEDGAGVGGGEEVQPAGAVGGDGDAGDAENGEDSAAMDAARKQQMRCEPVPPGSNPLSQTPHSVPECTSHGPVFSCFRAPQYHLLQRAHGHVGLRVAAVWHRQRLVTGHSLVLQHAELPRCRRRQGGGAVRG